MLVVHRKSHFDFLSNEFELFINPNNKQYIYIIINLNETERFDIKTSSININIKGMAIIQPYYNTYVDTLSDSKFEFIAFKLFFEEFLKLLKKIDLGEIVDIDDDNKGKSTKGILICIMIILILLVIAFCVYTYLKNRGNNFKFVSPIT